MSDLGTGGVKQRFSFPVLTGIEHGQGIGGITGSGLVRDEATGQMTREWMRHVGTDAVYNVDEHGNKGVFFDSRKIKPKNDGPDCPICGRDNCAEDCRHTRTRGGFEFL